MLVLGNSMENLTTKIRQELNTYQTQVAKRLEELYLQGLVSQTELKKILIDAETTGKAVVDGLASQEQYTEAATEIYVFSLFERYKSKIEKTIGAIEQQQKYSEIFIKGKRIPVYFENEGGKLMIPSQIEKEIAINFLENALDNPVKSIKIVVGNMLRELHLTMEETGGFFKSETYKIRVEEENQRIQSIYYAFGAAISQLVNSDYPEEVKNSSKSALLKEMQNRLGKAINKEQQKTKKSFFSIFKRGDNLQINQTENNDLDDNQD